MKIFKRGDGRFVVKFKDEIGRWKQRSFSSEKEAANFWDSLQEESSENSRLTVEEAVILYVRNHSISQKRKNIYSNIILGYDRNGKHRPGCAEHLRGRFVDTLNRRDLESFRDAGKAIPLSVHIINNYASMLKTCFRYAASQDLLDEVPWTKYGPMAGGKTGTRAAKEEDVLKVVTALPPWAQWICDTVVSLCLRPGRAELYSLKWDDFDWNAGCVSVYMSKVGRTKVVYPSKGYLARAKERRETSDSVYVCSGPRGGRGGFQFDLLWRRACKKLGVHVVPYALRHMAASRLLSCGVGIATVAEMLGHSNPATTASFYVHSSVKEQRAAAECLPDLHQNGADGAKLDG